MCTNEWYLKVFYGFVCGLLLGALVTGTTVAMYYRKDIDTNYCKIHYTNIGGFVFHKGRIYNLSELKNL